MLFDLLRKEKIVLNKTVMLRISECGIAPDTLEVSYWVWSTDLGLIEKYITDLASKYDISIDSELDLEKLVRYINNESAVTTNQIEIEYYDIAEKALKFINYKKGNSLEKAFLESEEW